MSFLKNMAITAAVSLSMTSAMISPSLAEGKLTIKDITENGNLSGSVPRGLKFSPDGKRVTFLKSSEEDSRVLDLWEYNLESKSAQLLVKSSDITGGNEELSEEERGRRERMRITSLGIVDFSWSKDGKKLLFPLGGDLYQYELAGGNTVRITNNPEYELDSRFSPGGNYVSYIEDNNLHIVDVRNNEHKQLTTSSSATVKNGVAEFIAMEEMDRDTGYWWSGDEKYIAYIQFDEKNIDQRGRYEVVRDGFNVLQERYPRAGTNNVTVKLGILSIETGVTKWVDLGEEQDIYLPRVKWVPDSSGIFFQKENRGQTQLDLIFADAGTADTRTVLTETSDTWINLNHGLTFLKNGSEFLWQSERSGFSHIYHYKNDGTLISQLTDGEWVVNGSISANEDNGDVYFVGNATDYLERHLYSVKLGSDKVTNPTKISKREGWHSVTIAGDGNSYIDNFSNTTTPPQVSIHNMDGSRLMWIEENKLDSNHPYYAFSKNHIQPEFGVIQNQNGDDLHYRMYKPANMEDGKKYPVIFALYGGPGSQMVDKSWDNLLFQVWAQDGYVVFTLDNRGTSNKGTEFAGALYHHMGKVEVEDQVVGAEFLKTLDFIDTDNIGVQGHSYGGYMVLMSMFTAPDVFKVGVSGAPVTDWRLYDTHYTERFLGHTDGAGKDVYDKSGVFPYIDGLKGKLLILHGMADDNVLFNHTSMLIDEMQQRAVQFDLMAYPGQTHRLGSDRMRRRHVYETQKRYFDDHLKN
ncbi:DPP IV N-terminal domain-containing protein [Pseudemcibacter aquimaris]|uniref:S9 family peptidase n=1 Tax=Pseudemcibacter aquimaris TaxID=2857064 RepID=UPI00201232E9|nr:DPP IV N-terminal domain-containing protein [Pseudemcibacter aquimaris]MCC3861379.1 S9 family peptidase [Pseudemcibacter aquimaris]WDU58149.1 S9 family peptidase [Pseudemcibacter aquimaris]